MNPHLRELLSHQNLVHLATLMEDGSPKVEPVWAGVEGPYVIVTTDAKSLKAINISRDGRVAFSVTSASDPYDQALVRGVVVAERADEELVLLDELSMRYLGRPYPRRRWSRRVVFVIEPRIVRCSKE